MKKQLVYYVVIVLGSIPLALWLYSNIHNDLWYDEVYSLEHFALVDFSTTLFYYPAPNNHIFYNLLTQVISRVLNLRDILVVENYSYVFRIFQLLISIGCLVYVLKILKKFFHIKKAALALVILFTTIPFMNFSLQLRGYGLSTLLLLMVLYYSWDYIQSKNRKALWATLLGSTLLLYTIPSNLYVLIGLCGTIAVFWVIGRKQRNILIYKNSFMVLVAIAIGTLLAVVLYLPIWEELVYNKFSNRSASGPLLSFYILVDAIPQFFSKRYLLLLLILPGIYFFLKETTQEKKRFFVALAVLFFGAFVASFIHQKSPYARVFIPLAPIFVLLLLVPILHLLEKLPNKFSSILKVVTCLYCTGIFIVEIDKSHTTVSRSLAEENTVSQNLYENYYLADLFQQDETMKYLASIHKEAPIVKFQQRDEPSTDLYLKKYHLSAEKIDTIIPAQLFKGPHETVFLLTSHKNNVLNKLKAIEGISYNVLTEENNFTNIIKLSNN
jgi:hypothetical protein